MDLKCKKLDCVYNNKFSCKSKKINIRQNLCCNTYRQKDKLTDCQKQDSSKTMFEVAPQYSPFRHKNNMVIHCEAHCCVFNRRGECCSNGVTVQRSNYKAYCATAIKEY